MLLDLVKKESSDTVLHFKIKRKAQSLLYGNNGPSCEQNHMQPCEEAGQLVWSPWVYSSADVL